MAGCAVAMALGKMSFDKVGKAAWFDVVRPFAFGMPTFDAVMILPPSRSRLPRRPRRIETGLID